MKEQIIAIWDKLGTLVGYDEHGWPITITKEDCADEIEKLYQCEHILEKVKEANTPDKRTFEEAETESKGQAWICPRCQKVHNWMVQHCDCPANVITASTTEPIPENYLNDCIEKATPNLSKIKDVDKELAEIRGEDKTCRTCRNKVLSPISKPCSYCLGFDEWEPIK